MNATLKKRWIAALMSGKYPQGDNYLYADGRYCCLGVLHHVMHGENPGAYYEVMPPLLQREGGRPFEMNEWSRALADLNDEGTPFEMIAGFIDANL